MHTISAPRLGRAAAAAVLFVGLSAVLPAQAGDNRKDDRLNLSAVAIDLDAGQSTPLRIVVERWTPDAEYDRLMKTLMTKGQLALVEEIRDTKRRSGYFRTLTTLAWDIGIARRSPGEDGGLDVMLITDRPIGFAETWNAARTVDYPFTVFNIHLKDSGESEGTLSLATKIIPDPTNNLMVVENYGTQRIRLVQVKRE